ncbi:MAG: TRAP transporter permease [Chloroflexi bacterium]|nr:TRAP transporter permease [Chloroflexota bacterium]
MRTKVLDVAMAVIGIGWSVFQLVYNSYVYLDPYLLRSFHVMFALVLTYLYTARKGKLSNRRITIYSVLAVISFLALLYIPLNQERLVTRIFGYDPLTTLDIIVGSVIVLLVLQTTWLTIGKPLVILTVAFILYTLFGHYLPGFASHSLVSFASFLDYLNYTLIGVFGLPIGVTSSYVYLFLIFAGFLVVTRAGDFFTDFAIALTGRTRGGPAKAAVVASSLVGTITGSAVANVVTTGTITIPLMKKTGYQPHFAGAVEAVASTGGQLVPPVMGAAAFVMAELTGIGYWRIVVAAILPSVLYYFALFVGVHLEAIRTGLGAVSGEKLPSVMGVLRDKGHVVLSLVILVILLARGYSPALSAFWGIIGLAALSFIRKSTRLGFKGFLEALNTAAKTAVTVVPVCACVGIIIASITVTGIGLKLASALTALTGGNVLALLVILMITAYILGMGMPTTAAYIIVAALVVPLLVMQGLPLISAHMFAFYFGLLSMITPPVALAAFAAASIAGSGPMKTAWTATRLGIVLLIVPYLFVYRPQLLLVGAAPLEVILAFAVALIGCFALAVALEGCLRRRMNILERLGWLAGAILVIYPGWQTTAGGLAILALLAIIHLLPRFRAVSRA